MFETLAAEVRDLRVPADSAAILELHAIRDQLDARLHDAVVEFDKAKLWDLDAATSLVAWLRDRADMTARQAGRLVHQTRALADLPGVRQAWHDGVLSGGQVDAIIGTIPAKHRALFAEHEADLVAVLAPLTLEDTTRALQHWVARADALAADHTDGEPEPEKPGFVHLSPLLDGWARIDGLLDPETHLVLRRMLELSDTPDVDGEPTRTPSERRHDALGNGAQFVLDHHDVPAGRRNRPHLNIIFDLDAGTGRDTTGLPVSRQVIDRLCCDSVHHRVVREGRSQILDYGTATRVVTNALWMALVIRDEHCRFPGCDRTPNWCDAHHVIWFSHGGETNQQNLVLLCRTHHRRLHQPGWDAKLLPDATLEVTDPAGITRTSHPPGALRPFDQRTLLFTGSGPWMP